MDSLAGLSKPVRRELAQPLPELPGLPDLAQIAKIIGHWEMTDARFAEGLDAGQLPAAALAQLGVRLCKSDQNAEAFSVLGAATALSPAEPTILNSFAVALDRFGQTATAVLAVERSLVIKESQTDSWIFLGTMKRKIGDPSGAQLAYETALRLEPQSSLIWLELGLLHKERREFLPAIECLLNSIRHGSVTAPVLSILGQLFFTTGQFEKARDAYAVALEMDPANAVYAQMHRQMRFVCRAMRKDPLESAIAENGAQGAALHELLHTTFALLSGYGHRDAAQRVAEKRLAIFPASATANYLMHAIRGRTALSRSPDAFLIEAFDKVADRFDEHLVNTLGYDIPQKLVDAVSRFLPADRKLDVLDAGCGTGLCGPLIRAAARNLTGVDLSSGMLRRAAGRQLYDQLVCEEITQFLLAHPGEYDLILAADVIIYFGELSVLASAMARAIRPGGLLAFSTERSEKPGYELLSSGRFAHHPDYIQSVFGGHFAQRFSTSTIVRYEANHAVNGEIDVFQMSFPEGVPQDADR